MADSPRPKILIVDDEPFNVDFLEQELEELGYDTISAYDGQAALDQVAAGAPDAVLLDIMMPVLDGFQVLERMKADPATRDLPVIVVSAMNDLASMVRGIELGALDYLPKPVETVMLRARLHTALLAKRIRDMELEYLEQVGQVVNSAIAVEAGTFTPESLAQVASRKDTLGQLARVFQRMANQVALREQRLKQQLEQARLDVEEMKKALSEPISVYLPMDRRQALARGESLPERMAGTALFADISGFTPLTASLVAELGLQQGAEELTRQLEQVYTALIAEVHRYGGSVIGFSGDAITCWLDGDDGQRGVACGQALQRAMQAFSALVTPRGTPVSIGIKVAIVPGKVRRFLVGDPGFQLVEVIAGRVLDELAQAEHHATRGEVIIPARLAEQLQETVTLSGWRKDAEQGLVLAVVSDLKRTIPPQPWPEQAPGTLSEEQCRPWLNPNVYERVCCSSKAFLAELRPAVALFLLFSGIDLEADPQAGEKLDAFIRWVQSVLFRYDGNLIQVTIGDKGSYLSIAFGAPVAHSDDPLRGVRAALEFMRVPAELDFIQSVQIGLAQGLMRTGAYGSSAQRTYGIMGDKVNLAARLMQAASSSEILCDEAIFHAVQGEIEMETLPPIKVKGKDELIAIFRPAGEKRTSVLRRTPLVGRAAERAQLQRSLADVQSAAGCVILLEGEAGMGKTRLIEDLLKEGESRRLRIFFSAVEENPTGPLAAWKEILTRALGLDLLPDFAAQAVRLRTLLERDPERLELAALLNQVWPAGMPESEATRRMETPDRLQRTARLLASLFLEAIQPAPALVVLDDAQNMDAASWELALALAASPAPLLIAIAARPLPMPLPAAYLSLFLLPVTQTLSLGPLSMDEAYLLACQRLDVAALPDQAVEMLMRASGNPFFILETVDLLKDTGALVVRGRDTFLSPEVNLSQIVIPGSIQGLVASRLDRLSPSQNLALKVASVIGRDFPLPLLQAAFPVEAEKAQLGEILQTLEWQELVSQTGPGPVYRFIHPITHELAYNSMLFSQRRQLHRQVAELYEQNQGQLFAANYETLADHWLKAGEPMKAIDYLETAGQEALHNGDYLEAERLFKVCLDLETQAAASRA